MKKIGLFLILIFFLGLAIIVPRIPQISDTLKGVLIPELEDITGEKVVVENISLNLFPLFFEAKGVRLLDEQGTPLVNAGRVKAYVDLGGIFSKRITLYRLVFYSPEISIGKQKLEEIIKHVQAYLEEEKKKDFKVKITVIEVRKGMVLVKDEPAKSALTIQGLSGEFITGEKQRLSAEVQNLVFEKEAWPRIVCDIQAAVVFRKDALEIKRLKVGAYGSKFTAEGAYSRGKGSLKTGLALIVNSVKRLFGLIERGEGRISAKGEIKIVPAKQKATMIRGERKGLELPELQNIFLDLKLSGDLYLQTLMELLKVKDQLEGLVDFQGEITGPLTDISGNAKAKLQQGNLYGVDIDTLSCNILYKDRIMKFENGAALLYNGKGQAEALIHLPIVDFYSLRVRFQSVDSLPVFGLIKWDPEIPDGKVDGELTTSGNTFNPEGKFLYKAALRVQKSYYSGEPYPVENVLSRIRDIKGRFSMHERIVSLEDLQIHTPLSHLTLNGTVNLPKSTMQMRGRLISESAIDLAAPYYKGLSGHSEFSGEIAGPLENLKISGRAILANATLEGYQLDSIVSDFAYERALLSTRETFFRSPGQEHTVKGKISFPSARQLFDVSAPLYDLKASLRKADFGKTVQIFYKEFAGQGRLNAEMGMTGRGRDFIVRGNASAENASVYTIPFDGASSAFTFTYNEFSLKKLQIRKDKSVLDAEATFSHGGKFSYNASAEKLFLKDLGLQRMPDDVTISLKSEGSGTFDNPVLTFHARVIGGTFKGKDMGRGHITASIRNKDISVQGDLFNEKMQLRGSGRLDERLPWSAELSIQPARYDFIVSSVLKDVPEDLELFLEGKMHLRGDRHTISVSTALERFTLSLFGQTLSNDSPIIFSLQNKALSVTACTLKSGTTSFSLRGGLEIGKSYNLSLEGKSALAPLKGMSKKIGYLKGDADFSFSISGPWDDPGVKGGMNVTDASVGLRDYPAYISSLNGHLFMDEDRIVLQKLTGKIGGGNITASGYVSLKAFKVKRFYVEAAVENVSTSPSGNFSLNFGGNLLLKGTPEQQNIVGDIRINRAYYKENIEWRSWIFQSKSKDIPRAETTLFEHTELNIRITGSDKISVDNNIARAPVNIRGDMILKGTLLHPVLFGRVESNEGYVYFRNNEFRIIHASADFADPNRIMPVFNFTAETTVSSYNIRLTLEGQIDHFTLALTSTPHLDEVDILALLTVGRIGSQMKGIEGGIGAGEATSFVAGPVADVIEERMKMITGIDRFQVEPAVSETTGTVSPRVIVSKRLIADKLYVTYSNLLGSTEEQIIKVEYLISRNISLVGIHDERRGVGGDIKFRFEFR
ncbi:MAG: translocation/assembly module TamB domain-containing protein [Thermodesulfovibrionales bacterium]|nr:translocation/assembly module TamB domain-containing protein [Thermodesulfovibrionales bacterium]